MLGDQPRNDEIEISLFGPRVGYGESIVIHIGDGSWVVIDSCRESDEYPPAALSYFDKIGVEPASAVRFVVASHWHGDHINGLAAVFEECHEARLVCSLALKCDELLALTDAYHGHPASSNKHGLEEISEVVSILRGQSPSLRYRHLKAPAWAASQRHLLDDMTASGVARKIISLSPSDAALLRAQSDFAQLAKEGLEGAKKSLLAKNPNHNAVVLWVAVGQHHLLFGSDLENVVDPGTGWNGVLAEFNVAGPKADVYKVSHHGSITGDHPDVWREMLSASPVAILTPFVKGSNVLPTEEDISRIKALTDKCYITARPNAKHRKLRPNVKRMVESATETLVSVDGTIGHLRLRKGIEEPAGVDGWEITMDSLSVDLHSIS